MKPGDGVAIDTLEARLVAGGVRKHVTAETRVFTPGRGRGRSPRPGHHGTLFWDPPGPIAGEDAIFTITKGGKMYGMYGTNTSP